MVVGDPRTGELGTVGGRCGARPVDTGPLDVQRPQGVALSRLSQLMTDLPTHGNSHKIYNMASVPFDKQFGGAQAQTRRFSAGVSSECAAEEQQESWRSRARTDGWH